MAWIAITNGEIPKQSVDITQKWAKEACCKKSNIKLPSSIIYTHENIYDVCLTPVIVQCIDDCTIFYYLN